MPAPLPDPMHVAKALTFSAVVRDCVCYRSDHKCTAQLSSAPHLACGGAGVSFHL